MTGNHWHSVKSFFSCRISNRQENIDPPVINAVAVQYQYGQGDFILYFIGASTAPWRSINIVSFQVFPAFPPSTQYLYVALEAQRSNLKGNLMYTISFLHSGMTYFSSFMSECGFPGQDLYGNSS